MKDQKHIDPEPDRRYIISCTNGTLDSAVVIDATDWFIRLQWDGDGSKKWYSYDAFQVGRELKILEQLETPR